ncbi:MAG: hypothetical protein ABIO59_12130 [Luteimonas sp.]
MPRAMLPLLLMTCMQFACVDIASARTMQAHIARVTTSVAVLQDVQVHLDWPATATQGALVLTAAKLDASDLGYHYRNLTWKCPLRRARGHWLCDGNLQSDHGAPLRFAVDLGDTGSDASLSRGASMLSMQRRSATPDDTIIDLTQVPLTWSQALLARGWQAGRLKSGTLDGRLRVRTPKSLPLQVIGTLAFANAAVDTPDATIAGDHLGGRFDIDYRKTPQQATVTVDGPLLGGEFLYGNAYVALPGTPVKLHLQGRLPVGQGWQLPMITWRDGDALMADGSAAFDAQTNLQSLDMRLHSRNIAPLGQRYLSGWLALAGLGDLRMSGAADASVRVACRHLTQASATLHAVNLLDPKGRFRFDGIDGTPRFSATQPVSGNLQWTAGQVYGLDFGAAMLPIDSHDGMVQLRNAVNVPALGGSLGFDHMTLRTPTAGAGADIRFGLTLHDLDVGQLAHTMHWPAFQGQLSGRIPNAHYADERLNLDGGLTMQLFGGSVQASSLSMERPFGVAPSLTTDLVLDNIDLQSLTGVFDFGSITGRLSGQINALRLVDWTATAFDAELHTVPVHGVRQRISQRAVQNISSVGDTSFTSTLQSQLIGLFKDFGYRRIGITCTLVNQVCRMGGLQSSDHPHSEAGGFTIVEGAGIPHLTVVGFNRDVDWPTLLERLTAVSRGDVKPIVK